MACFVLHRRVVAHVCALTLTTALFLSATHADSVKILYNFSASEQGLDPSPGLAEGPDGRLYGATSNGGPYGEGTLFSIRPDGTDFRTVFIFDEATTGSAPAHVHIGADGRIYGASRVGPPPDPLPGSIFSVRRDGTDFKFVWVFDSYDGEDPTRLIEHDGRLYGTTRREGADPAQGVPFGSGTVYSVRNDGSDFRLLKAFHYDRDGSDPSGGVTLAADGRLYGITEAGGRHDGGTLYSLDRDGTNFMVHRHLGSGDGSSQPRGRLLAGSDGYLYGVAGAWIVRFLPGDDHDTLVFDASAVPGEWRLGPELTETSDGRIHGTVQGFAQYGFEANGVFSVNRDGSHFVLHHVFDSLDEFYPNVGWSQLLQAGNGRIYAAAGGGPFISGVLISYNPDGSDLQEEYGFGGAPTGGHEPIAGVVYARDHRLYGLARRGGRQEAFEDTLGTLYSLKPDGSDFRVHHLFDLDDSGANPDVALIEGSNGWLYGSTPFGGKHYGGTIFSVRPGTGKLQVLHHLTREQGKDVSAPLVEGPGGVLYGVAREGGLPQGGGIDGGTVFSLHRTGQDFRRLHAMSPSPVPEGYFPVALVINQQGRLLISTSDGGAFGRGTTALLDRNGANFRVLQDFHPNEPIPPQTLMRPQGPWIFATTFRGVSRARIDSLSFSPLQSVPPFQPRPERNPASSQLFHASDGRLYGATGAPHGAYGEGTLYSIDLLDRSYHVHHHFGGDTAGMAPQAPFTEGPDGTLYATGLGGEYGVGAVFALVRDLKVIAGPEDTTFYRNVPSQLFVFASGPGPLYYHWYRNGKLIHRSSSNALDLGKAAPGDAGHYHVVVKNRFGSVTSRTATVVVE